MSKKYYFVQLSTGASQWDTPTQPAPTGPTPQATPQGVEHPYGLPGANESNHGYGDNTQQHGGEMAADGTRGGPDGERGIGVSFLFAFLYPFLLLSMVFCLNFGDILLTFTGRDSPFL